MVRHQHVNLAVACQTSTKNALRCSRWRMVRIWTWLCVSIAAAPILIAIVAGMICDPRPRSPEQSFGIFLGVLTDGMATVLLRALEMLDIIESAGAPNPLLFVLLLSCQWLMFWGIGLAISFYRGLVWASLSTVVLMVSFAVPAHRILSGFW